MILRFDQILSQKCNKQAVEDVYKHIEKNCASAEGQNKDSEFVRNSILKQEKELTESKEMIELLSKSIEG